jgi:sugar-specific transcriptional regulator TrmB
LSLRLLREKVGENELEELLRLLKFLGVSTTESRVYLFLLTYGPMTVREISEKMNAAQSKIYTAVESLEKRNWVYKGTGRPAKIHPTHVEEVWRYIKERLNRMMDNIETKVVPALQSLEAGRANYYKVMIVVEPQIEHIAKRIMFEDSKEVKVAIGDKRLITPGLMEALIYAARWKTLKLIFPPDLEEDGKTLENLGAQVRYKKIFGGGIIGDEILLIINMGEELTGLWSDHAFFKTLGDMYFDRLWNE